MVADLLGGDEKTVGTLTTGGTESILMAFKSARQYAKERRGITEPEAIIPNTAHPAAVKACHYFNIKPVNNFFFIFLFFLFFYFFILF